MLGSFFMMPPNGRVAIELPISEKSVLEILKLAAGLVDIRRLLTENMAIAERYCKLEVARVSRLWWYVVSCPCVVLYFVGGVVIREDSGPILEPSSCH
jgi:hypothetical protein